MKRRFCFLFMLAAVFVAGPGAFSTLMATDLPDIEAPSVTTIQGGDERSEGRQMDF